MASGQTQYYELNQWEGRDQVLRTEFNADTARIDRALHELRARNCQLYMLTYTGTGSGGRSFTFPHRPAAVLIMGGIVTFLCAIQGESYIYLRYGNVDNKSRAVWEGSTVSWELANDDPVLAANAARERYTLLALLDTGDQIVIAAALSFICSMGDLMPPTALAGNYAAQIVEQKYSRVLRHCAIPFIVCILYGLVTLLVSGNLSFLT